MAGPAGNLPCGAVLVFGKRTCKPNSVQSRSPAAVIPLGGALPRALSSDLPGGSGNFMEQPCGTGPVPGASLAPDSRLPPYLVLLRVGFTMPAPSPAQRCALTAPFHPYPGTPWRRNPGRYVFCGTGRPRALTPASRTLSGTLPFGVRTFLSRRSRVSPRSGSDRPVLLPGLFYLKLFSWLPLRFGEPTIHCIPLAGQAILTMRGGKSSLAPSGCPGFLGREKQ